MGIPILCRTTTNKITPLTPTEPSPVATLMRWHSVPGVQPKQSINSSQVVKTRGKERERIKKKWVEEEGGGGPASLERCAFCCCEWNSGTAGRENRFGVAHSNAGFFFFREKAVWLDGSLEAGCGVWCWGGGWVWRTARHKQTRQTDLWQEVFGVPLIHVPPLPSPPEPVPPRPRLIIRQKHRSPYNAEWRS